MLTCKEVAHLLSETQDRKLTLGERLQLNLHISMCRGCTNLKKQMAFLRAASRRYARGEADDAKGQ